MEIALFSSKTVNLGYDLELFGAIRKVKFFSYSLCRCLTFFYSLGSSLLHFHTVFVLPLVGYRNPDLRGDRMARSPRKFVQEEIAQRRHGEYLDYAR